MPPLQGPGLPQRQAAPPAAEFAPHPVRAEAAPAPTAEQVAPGLGDTALGTVDLWDTKSWPEGSRPRAYLERTAETRHHVPQDQNPGEFFDFESMTRAGYKRIHQGLPPLPRTVGQVSLADGASNMRPMHRPQHQARGLRGWVSGLRIARLIPHAPKHDKTAR